MADHGSGETPHWDSEINVGQLLAFGVGLVVLGALSAAGVYWFQAGTQGGLAADDSPASPIQRVVADPRVGPQLQMNPDLDLALMRDSNRAALGSWGWVDRGSGVVRMPIDEAIEWVASHGIEAATAAVAGRAAPELGAADASGAAPGEPSVEQPAASEVAQ